MLPFAKLWLSSSLLVHSVFYLVLDSLFGGFSANDGMECVFWGERWCHAGASRVFIYFSDLGLSSSCLVSIGLNVCRYHQMIPGA